jgi:hypothetical protein
LTFFLVQNAELALQFERRAREIAEKRLEEFIAFGRGRGGRKGLSFGAGIDVGTQTDGAVSGEVLGQVLGASWAEDIFGGGEEVCDEDLDSAVMLQRAAAATFVMNDLKRSEKLGSTLSAGVEMALPDTPRWGQVLIVFCHIVVIIIMVLMRCYVLFVRVLAALMAMTFKTI